MPPDVPSSVTFEYRLYYLTVREPTALLARLIQYFHKNAHLSLKGDFEFSEDQFEGLSHAETTALRHSTWQAWKNGIEYEHNFIVIPLSVRNVRVLDKMLAQLDLAET